MNIMEFFESFALTYEKNIMWVVLLFSFMHPLTENPWSLFTLSLALTALGVIQGYLLIITGYLIGVVVLYVLVRFIHQKSDCRFMKLKGAKKVLNWVASTSTLRHILVIGMPNIPTYPIKISLPLTTMSFTKYIITLMGSYLFLTIMNSLLYFGIFSLFGINIPRWVSIL